MLSWLHVPGERLRRRASRADVDLSAQRRLGARRDRGRRARASAGPPGCTSRSTPGCRRDGAVRRRLARPGRRGPRGCRPRAPSALVGVWSPLRLRRRARPPHGAPQQRALRRGASRSPSAPGCAPEVRHLANSAGHARATRRALRPRAARASRSTASRPVPDVGDPATLGLRPAMTLRGRARPGQAACRPAQGVSYGHPYVTDRETDAGAGAGRLRRRHPAARDQRRRRCCVGGARRRDRRTGLHGPVRRRRRPGRGRAPGDEVVLFGAGRPRRADRAGLGRRDRHHQLRDRHPASAPRVPRHLRRRAEQAREPAPQDPRHRASAAAASGSLARRRPPASPPTGPARTARRDGGRSTTPELARRRARRGAASSLTDDGVAAARRDRPAADGRGTRRRGGRRPVAPTRCRPSAAHGYSLSLRLLGTSSGGR